MNQTIWITGGSRGIGAAAVRLFARQGWQTAFTYRSSHEKAQALAQALTAEGCRVLAVQADMRVRAEAERAADLITRHFGQIDSLICNAGIAQQKMFCDITDDDWENMFAANVKSAFYCIQAAQAGMVRRKAGTIVTVSSVWGVTGASCESHYAASKGALIALSKSLAQELGPSGIRVNCLAPGVIATDMNAVHDQTALAALRQETALCRLGTPEEVAKAMYFLCSDDAAFITGQVIGITGGFMI